VSKTADRFVGRSCWWDEAATILETHPWRDGSDGGR
jgi:hypothetical protein